MGRLESVGKIKSRCAIEVYEYLRAHSTLVRVLEEPCARARNYKSKTIVAVASMDEAQALVHAVDKLAERAAKILSGETYDYIGRSRSSRPAISYHSRILNLEDPTVTLSIREAETVYKLKMCDIFKTLHMEEDRAIDVVRPVVDPQIVGTRVFWKLLKEEEAQGTIDMSSDEVVRLSRLSGDSYRIQAIVVERDYAIQANVGDLVVLAYPQTDKVQVVPARQRKERSDRADLSLICEHATWRLHRYNNN